MDGKVIVFIGPFARTEYTFCSNIRVDSHGILVSVYSICWITKKKSDLANTSETAAHPSKTIEQMFYLDTLSVADTKAW